MRKIHYGWVIVLAGMIITALAAGMAINCFTLFIVPVCEDLHFTRGQMGVCQTINAVGFLLASFISGWLYRRVPLRRVMQTAAVLQTAAFFLYARANSLWMFYGCSAINSLCGAFLTWIPLSMIINNWFQARRALAIGAAFMGSGVGGMAASFAGGLLMEAFGWRQTFAIFGLALLLVLIPVVFFVLRVKPSDMGLRPFGEGEESEGGEGPEDAGALLKDALKTGRFYGICLCLFAFGLSSNGFTATFAPHFQDSGYDPVAASALFAAYMLILAIGKLIMGVIFDKIGTWKTTITGIACMILTLASMILCRFPAAIAVMFVCAGVGNCYTTVGIPVMTRSVYGQKEYASFVGMLNAACNIGSTISPSVLGFVRDWFGSYVPGYAGAIVMMAAFGAMMILSVPKKPLYGG